MPLSDKTTIIDVLCEFFDIAFNQIIFSRKLYPATIFENKRKYGITVHQSIHPDLNNYINECLKAINYHLKKNQLRKVFLCLHSGGKIVEKYFFEVLSFGSTLESDVFLVKLEQVLRDFCLKVHSSGSYLQELPDDTCFSIQLIVTEYSSTELNQDPKFECYKCMWNKQVKMSNNKKRRIESETSKTVKGFFKRDDWDDSLSTSALGLVIDDSPPKKRSHRVKLVEEPLNLGCHWDYCNEFFVDYAKLNEHLKEHLEQITSLEDLKCSWIDCEFSAKSWDGLVDHLYYHGYHEKLKSIGRNVEERLNLPKCTQKDKFQFPCLYLGYDCEWENCNEKFTNFLDFFDHIKDCHIESQKKLKQKIDCHWMGCNKTNFPRSYKLAEHMRIHTKEKLIACPTCGNLFACKTKFSDHRQRQLPERLQSYLCSQCSKYFPSERLLRDHMMLHINHYKCSMCEMTCPKPSILAKHFRYRHMNEKPYKCNICDYTCVSKHNLDFHMNKHSEKKLYNCEKCFFKCRSAYGLLRHEQRRHGTGWKNVYECDNCKKRFNRGSHLTNHLMKVHKYHWPSGHSRFRYKIDSDGIYRLQTVRYETIDVTEEIIKGNTVKEPKMSANFKICKKEDANSRMGQFEVEMVKEKKEENTFDDLEDKVLIGEDVKLQKKVVITIDDLDAKGNVLKTKVIQSSEIICSDLNDINSVCSEIMLDPLLEGPGTSRDE